jgi:hypothetical protein
LANNIFGFRYVPPKTGTNIVGWTSGIISIEATSPNAADLADIDLTFNPAKNSFAASGTEAKELSLTVTPATGLVAGTYIQPSARITNALHTLEFNGAAWGFYAGTNDQTGPVVVAASVDPAPAALPANRSGWFMSTGSVDESVGSVNSSGPILFVLPPTP